MLCYARASRCQAGLYALSDACRRQTWKLDAGALVTQSDTRLHPAHGILEHTPLHLQYREPVNDHQDQSRHGRSLRLELALDNIRS
jgi:hypothetical protein